MNAPEPASHRDKRLTPAVVQDVEKRYERSVFWSRMMYAAFFTVAAFTVLWAVPWFPGGTDVADYNSRVAMLAVLGLSAALFAFIAVRLRDHLRRAESTYITVSTVHDKLTDMRRREYFYDRLLLECDRAKQTGGTFAVVVLRIATNEARTYEVSPIQRVVEALEPVAKEYDWLAPIGVQEVAMFTPRLSADLAPIYANELADRVMASVKDVSGIRVLTGWACYGRDLVEAGDLVGNARRMVARIDPPQVAAA